MDNEFLYIDPNSVLAVGQRLNAIADQIAGTNWIAGTVEATLNECYAFGNYEGSIYGRVYEGMDQASAFRQTEQQVTAQLRAGGAALYQAAQQAQAAQDTLWRALTTLGGVGGLLGSGALASGIGANGFTLWDDLGNAFTLGGELFDRSRVQLALGLMDLRDSQFALDHHGIVGFLEDNKWILSDTGSKLTFGGLNALVDILSGPMDPRTIAAKLIGNGINTGLLLTPGVGEVVGLAELGIAAGALGLTLTGGLDSLVARDIGGSAGADLSGIGADLGTVSKNLNVNQVFDDTGKGIVDLFTGKGSLSDFTTVGSDLGNLGSGILSSRNDIIVGVAGAGVGKADFAIQHSSLPAPIKGVAQYLTDDAMSGLKRAADYITKNPLSIVNSLPF